MQSQGPFDQNDFPALGASGPNNQNRDPNSNQSYAGISSVQQQQQQQQQQNSFLHLSPNRARSPPGIGDGQYASLNASLNITENDFPALASQSGNMGGRQTPHHLQQHQIQHHQTNGYPLPLSPNENGPNSMSSNFARVNGQEELSQHQNSLLGSFRNGNPPPQQYDNPNHSNDPFRKANDIGARHSSAMNNLINDFSRQNINHQGPLEQDRKLSSESPNVALGTIDGRMVNIPNSPPPCNDSMTETEKFGLKGILGVIKQDNPESMLLPLGKDLHQYGLPIPGNDRPLWSTFFSPWGEPTRAMDEPSFSLPGCYNVSVPPPMIPKVASFGDDTLFYMFYTFPRDVCQELAAQELSNRGWRFHKDHRVWLTKDVASDPYMKNNHYERGHYVFFNPETWERQKLKDFALVYADLENRAFNPLLGLPAIQ
ncbi:General negative regulator of transcription subunit 2 [Neolecta irregularis DAH-3]|uniref:General negative regulator of transcription subunit 2 n=1 Tax=Neolecta irregularis (strain DAH-3) TaxID=1198029 RepID=A0A1U7LSQ5_NEOID|nr:General negative regulator of transcription subunit 2 [Neolecta irregularis DAH-3]|eukprot:OLL25551.1 General negative regulator of transcription subunit 2 [Neolecta irregularis DAH-3]